MTKYLIDESSKTIFIKSNHVKIMHKLSLKITIIIFSGSFNQPLNNIPNTINCLYFNSLYFKQPLNNLPNSIIEIEINIENYDFVLNNLPNLLQKLKVYNLLCNNLPNSLIHLTILYNKPYHLNNLHYLPKSIKILILIIHSRYDASNLNIILPIITNLKLSENNTYNYDILSRNTCALYKLELNK